jgi:hypothetical protein
MRQYFTNLRLHRISDQMYQTLHIRWEAESLGDLDRQLTAFEMGLKVAGGGVLGLDNVHIDVSPGGVEYFRVGDPNMLLELQYFLGTRRDRRHKAPPKTETELENSADAERNGDQTNGEQ